MIDNQSVFPIKKQVIYCLLNLLAGFFKSKSTVYSIKESLNRQKHKIL